MSQYLTERSHRTSSIFPEVSEYLVRHFGTCEEVSSVFIRPDWYRPGGEAEVAVLVRDAGMEPLDIAGLEDRYAREVSACGLGPVRVSVLNITPARRKHSILSTWPLVLERNHSFRAWFTEQAMRECRDIVQAA